MKPSFFNTNQISNSEKRNSLFKVQSIIVTLLLLLTTISFFSYNNLEVEKGIKVIFAPFLSVVPLLFILTILRDLRKGFIDGDYSRQAIMKFCLVTLCVTAAVVLLTLLMEHIASLELLLASVIALISVVFFLKSKIRDLLGMSIVTGIAEGVIVYMIFLF